MNLAEAQAARYGAQIVKTFPDWISSQERLPTESGRYLGVICELTDLSFSYYVWNVYYDVEDNRWSSEYGSRITHWMQLPELPNQQAQK